MATFEESQRGAPHNWNSLDNYRFLHRKHLGTHPLVRPNGYRLSIEVIDLPHSSYDRIILRSEIACTNGLLLEITKFGDLDRTSARRVRMYRYRYNVHFPRGENVLRYDNMHVEEPDVYHRHVFDPETGDQTSFTTMTRAQFPVMHQVLDELMQMFPPQ